MKDRVPPHFPNLYAEMSRYRVRVRDLAELLNLSTSATEKRLSGAVRIRHNEMWLIRDTLFPYTTIDYLFGQEPSHNRKETTP